MVFGTNKFLKNVQLKRKALFPHEKVKFMNENIFFSQTNSIITDVLLLA